MRAGTHFGSRNLAKAEPGIVTSAMLELAWYTLDSRSTSDEVTS